DGTAQQFRDCYGPTWGRQLARTRPSPGNHEYHTEGGAGYFGYFGAAAGESKTGYYAYDQLDRATYQSQESHEFDRMIDRTTPALASQRGSATARGTALRPVSTTAATIGRLSVPRLNMTAMVREGIDLHTLALAVGHIPGTPLPGETGNVALAGHRDTFFRGLRNLKTNDEIRFATVDGDFTYVVESISIVEPDDVGVLASSAASVLTLVTCYPFSYTGNAPKRFVARARQVSPLATPTILQ
ncbi:MAG: class D sortase, partial [Bryobacteraceae bacterium]